MGSTYLSLTNKLLRKFNEVQISQADFMYVRNIQAAAKDFIQDAIRDINMVKFRWPFNAYEYTTTLVPGQEEYSWPLDFQAVDWNSFQIQKDDTLNVESTTLVKINRDQWYDYRLKDRDYDSHPDGLRLPKWVSESHGNGFMVTPSPNEAFSLKFRYYVEPTELSAYDDTTTIPTRFDNVIIANASRHMALFRGDTEMADRMKQEYDKLLSYMITQLYPQESHAYDTRVNFGGNAQRSYIWTGQ